MIVLILGFIINNSEARVYCQDRHASQWKTLGKSCPITCNTIFGAIDLLKQIDDQYTAAKNDPTSNSKRKESQSRRDLTPIDQRQKSPNDLNSADINKNLTQIRRRDFIKRSQVSNRNKGIQDQKGLSDLEQVKNGQTRPNALNETNQMKPMLLYKNRGDVKVLGKQKLQSEHNKRREDLAQRYMEIYQAFMKIEPQKFIEAMENQLNFTEILNMTCYTQPNRSRLLSEVLNECTISPHVPQEYIFNKVQSFLNNLAHPDYKFYKYMTLMILKDLLSNASFDTLDDTLTFLLRELQRYMSRLPAISRKDTITLKSRHCMTISVPGCYCRTGYIENNGRCVSPEHCSNDPEYSKYLTRITIE